MADAYIPPNDAFTPELPRNPSTRTLDLFVSDFVSPVGMYDCGRPAENEKRRREGYDGEL